MLRSTASKVMRVGKPAVFLMGLGVIVCMVLLAVRPAEATQLTLIGTKGVTVSENSALVDTKIDMKTGDELVITATGTIEPATFWTETGPDGYTSTGCDSKYPIPCANPFGLIGKIGFGSGYFFIGRDYDREHTGRNGRLWLRTNDDWPGNGRGNFNAHIQIYRDITPPDTSIDSGPSGTVNSNTANFFFSSSEVGSRFECNLDGHFFTACTSPKEYPGLDDGAHSFQVRAVDAVGNVDTTPASRLWTVDGTLPSGTVSIRDGAAYTTSVNVSLALSTNDPSPGSGVSSMRFSNDGSTWSAWEPYGTSKSWSLSSGDGPKTVFVQYKDGAGNLSETAQDTIELDTTAPKVKKVVPTKGAKDIAPGTNVSVFFSEAMKEASITPKTFKLYRKGSTDSIAVEEVSYEAQKKKAMLNPKDNLKRGVTYKAVVTTAVKDAAGNRLQTSKVWFFTTKT